MHYLVGPSEQPTSTSAPTITLSLGWPGGIAAEIPLSLSPFVRLGRALWFAPLARRLFLVGAHVEIIVPEDDSGRLQVVLGLANFCRTEVVVTALHVDYLAVGNGSLSDLNPHLELPEFHIPQRRVGEVVFSCRLGGGEIRDLQRFIGQASYPKSSPMASTGIRGTLSIRHWRGSEKITFDVGGIVPHLIMYNPSNKAGIRS